MSTRALRIVLFLGVSVVGVSCSSTDGGPAEAAGAHWEARTGLAGTGQALAVFDDGHPGTIVSVAASMGVASDPTLAQSVALSPLACAGDVETIRWLSMGGVERSRPARKGQQSWNPQTPDGWISFDCEDGQSIQVAHRVGERTTSGLVSLRNDQGQAIFAPLGTFWGTPPFHEGRRIGGFGAGEIITNLIGAQFRPSAADWSGAQFSYRLLVGDSIDSGTLDLFAHPPLARAGAYVAP